MFPKWNTLNSSSVYSMTSVMEIDGLKSTHEVSVEICKSKDIEQVFDDISYEKVIIFKVKYISFYKPLCVFLFKLFSSSKHLQ